MKRVPSVFRVAFAAMLLVLGVSRVHAQAQTPAPAAPAAPAQKPAEEEEPNPFAPQPAPTLPPGMTGADTNDPRYKLAPGLYDAGETAMGIKHLVLVKKPDAFQLGASDPDDPKVQKTLGQLGMANK